MSSIDQSGTFNLGDRTVKRLGYGAMQLAGLGVFGPPKHRDAALAVLREAALTTSTPATSTARTSPPTNPRGARALSRRSRHRHQDRRPARRGWIMAPGLLARSADPGGA